MSVAKEDMKELVKINEELMWQSIGELEASPEERKQWADQEFQERPLDREENDRKLSSTSRRGFFKWVGAASALMSSAACTRRPKDYLVPYIDRPEGYTYGVPVWYASSTPNGLGVLVKTREGRPIKLEGNPDHEASRGGLDASTQAEMLNLYNPERLQRPFNIQTSKDLSWDEAFSRAKAALSEGEGEVYLITDNIVSPWQQAEIDRFTSAFKAKHLSFSADSYRSIAEAHDLVFGRPVVPYIEFEKAKTVVSVDADFLGTWLRPVEFTKGFSKTRRVHDGEEPSQLFSFESRLTNTGITADYRTPIKPSQQLKVVLTLINELSSELSFEDNIKKLAANYSADSLSQELGVSKQFIQSVAKALASSRENAVVVASATGPQALAVQAAVIALNSALGAYGSVMPWDRTITNNESSHQELVEFLEAAQAGRVRAVVFRNSNLAYHKPNFGVEEALSAVKFKISITHEVNETALLSDLALPESHFLEAWGDNETISGMAAIQQPTIEPLFSSKSFNEILRNLRGVSDVGDLDDLRASWAPRLDSVAVKSGWQNFLAKGFEKSAGNSYRTSPRWTGAFAKISESRGQKFEGIELVAYKSVQMGDGSNANNAWLQELPDPITKVVWDNYALISKATADKLGVFARDMKNQRVPVVQIQQAGRSISIPAFVQPGMRDDVVAVAMGYGRTKAGTLGTNVGSNVAQLLDFDKVNEPILDGRNVQLIKTDRLQLLAATQQFFKLEDPSIHLEARYSDVLQHATYHEFKKDPRAAKGIYKKKDPDIRTMYEPHIYSGHKWGMSIDLNKCTSCNACVVACQSENNIATVGREQAAMGRHLQWLRLDVYYQGEPENPTVHTMPMLCQHCEKAPCETVCPVLATVHSSDGLNGMIYNRCVGTRYCANNCPYKVRRFNYFQYSDELGPRTGDNIPINDESPISLLLNPDVTVRSRGVMEKCTFCVQRIRKGVDVEKAKQGKDYKFSIPDGSIKTACQQSCPADAIEFGDLNDANSKVRQNADKVQGFKSLEILNVRPSITYLPRLRNKELSS